jgi:radical SAM superfamily enzyme YgiQ (UPF0313 family)
LGLLYIAAYLREHGLPVIVLDLNVKKQWPADLALALRAHDPTIVGLTSNFANRFTTRKIAASIKNMKEGIIIVAGGPHPTIAPDEYRNSGIDYIIPFEAEKKMLEFVLSEDRSELKGVIACAGQPSAPCPSACEQSYIQDLDGLPFPAYDLIDVSKYHINSFKKKPIVSMVTSRGCPCRCVFCSQAVFGRKWRARSAANVVEEMVWLKDKIGVREISIEDDNFTLDMDRVKEICELIKSRGLSIPWQLANGIRADRVTKELLMEMKEAGCWKIAIAPEVGDEESIKRIGKGIELDQFRQVARWCKELGIVYYGFFLMGFPFQKEEHIRRIVDFSLELDPLLMDLSKIVPFPGTVLFDEMNMKGKVCLDKVSTYYEKTEDNLLNQWHRRAYMKFYIRPAKILQIIRVIGFYQFFRLVQYGIGVFFQNKNE